MYPLSIDEAILDLKGCPALKTRSMEDVARDIKRRVREGMGEHMRISVGISTNVLLAKVAAGLDKPDGLRRIDASNAKEVLHGLNVGGPQDEKAALRFLVAQREALRNLSGQGEGYPDSFMYAWNGSLGAALDRILAAARVDAETTEEFDSLRAGESVDNLTGIQQSLNGLLPTGDLRIDLLRLARITGNIEVGARLGCGEEPRAILGEFRRHTSELIRGGPSSSSGADTRYRMEAAGPAELGAIDRLLASADRAHR